jgi:solute carrier family 25 carnitine/acylcarnitine transporter 20/29
MPIPGGTLGGEPQRLRVAARDQDAYVGVDTFGKSGATITKGVQDAGNGMLFGIADVLEPPPDLGELVSSCTCYGFINP